MSFEIIEHNGLRLAEVLYRGEENDSTIFYSDDKAALQLGLMSHPGGFIEAAHSHPLMERESTHTQQAFVVLRGKVIVDFFDSAGNVLREIELSEEDSILIIQGIHRIRVVENSKCVTIKQGPFVAALDKVEAKF